MPLVKNPSVPHQSDNKGSSNKGSSNKGSNRGSGNMNGRGQGYGNSMRIVGGAVGGALRRFFK